MLFDPKWNGPSLAGFIGWLETKNPRQQYDFENCKGECLIGQYMASLGIEWGETPSVTSVIGREWTETKYWAVCEKIFGKGPWNVLHERPWTYGSALRRARKFVADD